MGENFESEENKEDVVDIMSSLTRELAENQENPHLAQMVQNAKDLWARGEKAAAYWILEAFRMGQKDVLGSTKDLDKSGRAGSELTKRVCENEQGLWKKFGDITQEMGRSPNSLL